MKRSPSQKQSLNTEKHNEAAKAVGAIIAFYRRVHGITQKKLTTGANGMISASSLAMIEGGHRLPTEKALRFLADRLELSQFQTDQLTFIAQDLTRTDEQRLQTIAPSDVTRGVALFLRPPGDDSTLLEGADVREVWIVTKSPLTTDSPYYEMMRKRVNAGRPKFIYFLDSDAGKSDFQKLLTKLKNDPQVEPSAKLHLADRLKCMVIPSTLTIFGFVLFNPGVPGRMFGRSVVMDPTGLPIGVIPMDATKVTAAFAHLSRINSHLSSPELRHRVGKREEVQGIGFCEFVAP